MDAIELKNVSKRLGDFAIQDLSLVLPKRILSFIG